jgi:hypothetical protein
MARLDRGALMEAAQAALAATPDPDGVSDLVGGRGHMNVAASAGELKAAVQRLVPLSGYRWIVINDADLFAASPLTIGTKVGILGPTGRVLKNADLPRAR